MPPVHKKMARFLPFCQSLTFLAKKTGYFRRICQFLCLRRQKDTPSNHTAAGWGGAGFLREKKNPPLLLVACMFWPEIKFPLGHFGPPADQVLCHQPSHAWGVTDCFFGVADWFLAPDLNFQRAKNAALCTWNGNSQRNYIIHKMF